MMALALTRFGTLEVTKLRCSTRLHPMQASTACVKQKLETINVSPIQRLNSKDSASMTGRLWRKLSEKPTQWCDKGRSKVGLASNWTEGSVDSLWLQYVKDHFDWWEKGQQELHPSFADFRPNTTPEAVWKDHGSTPKRVAEALERKIGSMKVSACSFQSGSRLDSERSPETVVDVKSFHRAEYSWTARISQYTKGGQARQALGMYKEMRKDGVEPSPRTFVALLKACSTLQDLESAKTMNAEVVRSGFESNLYVGTMLVDAYVKCRSLVDAKHAFEKLPHRDVVSWTALISGYAQMNKGEEALKLYTQMQQEGVVPNGRTYVSALKACCIMAESGGRNESNAISMKKRCLEVVRAIHRDILRQKFESDVFVGTMLVDVYGKCGSLDDARHVFEKMSIRTVVTWNTMILVYAQMDKGEEALQLYTQMQVQGFVPQSRTYVSALRACSTMAESRERNKGDGKALRKQCLDIVKAIHADVVSRNFEADVFVGNMLVNVYTKCESLEDARRVFEKMPRRDVVSWNAMILGYAQLDRGDEAFKLYFRMQREAVVPDSRTYVSVLKACSSLAELGEGNGGDGIASKAKCLETVRSIHADLAKQNFEEDLFVGNILVNVYAKCGSLGDARSVFEKIPHRDVISWTAMILGYAQVDKGEEALELFSQMQQEGVVPDGRTYVSALKACSTIVESVERNDGEGKTVKEGCLQTARSIHSDILKGKFESDAFVGTMLVDVYAKCGSLDDARRVFEKMPNRTVVSWNAMILEYAHMGKREEALQLYTRMRLEGVAPNDRTYVSVLKACSTVTELGGRNAVEATTVKEGSLETVRSIHREVVKAKVDADVFVGTMLVDAYAKHGSLEDARSVFEQMPGRTVVSWNAMILGYVQMAKGEEALELYTRMKQEGIVPNDRTYVSVLKSVSTMAESGEQNEGDGMSLKSRFLRTVRSIHADIVKAKFESDVFVGNMLVGVYAKCGSLDDARVVFEKIPHRDVVSWNALILGYAQMEKGEYALQLYSQMQTEGVVPDDRTYVSALKACRTMAPLDAMNGNYGMPVQTQCLETVKSIHLNIMTGKFESDVFVGNMLVDVYVKCGSLEDARRVFEKMPDRTVVSWNAMILGYAQVNKGEDALKLYTQMQQEGVVPDGRTYVGALKACSSELESGERSQGDGIALKQKCLEAVREIHANIVKSNIGSDVFVETMLLDVYAKCGSLADARRVFEKMPHRDVASWTAMILGYAQMDKGEEALQLYGRMQQERMVPDGRTYVAALNACGSVAGLEKGKEIHDQILIAGLEGIDSFVTPSLIDMYSKCGSMADAQQVFDAMPLKGIVAWNALISGYSHQGESELVFDLFGKMKQEGVQPDSITLLAVLTVCSHVGLVDKGQKYFEAISKEYGITPTMKHFTCVVDLLGRSGQLKEAMEIAKAMPFQPDSAIWKCILGACRKWGDVDLARQAFECAVRLDRDDAAAYVLMSNIYAAAHMKEEAKAMQTARVKSQAWKQPGRSQWTDFSGETHGFVVGDRRHPESQDIYAKLGNLLVKMKKLGYVAHLESVSRDMPDDEKADSLCGHSERLAIAYALLKTPAGTTIRVVKNLRVCEDCHRAIGFISRIEQRTIICRDAIRFHVYKEGKCSCGDYW